MISCSIVDNNTGEVYQDDFKMDTLEDKKRRSEFVKKKELDFKFRYMQNEYLGSFVFFIYKHIKKLSDTLTDVELVRYIYIGTYVKDDGVLKEGDTKIITKVRMRKLLQIGNTTSFNKYYDKLLENNLISESGEGIKINLNYFYRGSEKEYKKVNNKKFDDNFTRLYIDTTRKLYENTENRKKKQLVIVYKLLPYVNWKYNILCYNPYEIQKNKIKLLTIGNVIDILGYSKNQLTRFKKDFYTIPCESSVVFLSVQKQPEYLDSMVAVNPQAYYRGNSPSELEYLLTLFGLKEN